MTYQEDWRTAFPGVNAATRFIEKADEYADRLAGEGDAVVAEIRDRKWAEPDHEGVPQPDLDEVRRLFDRAADAIEDGRLEEASGHLEDVVAYCMPED